MPKSPDEQTPAAHTNAPDTEVVLKPSRAQHVPRIVAIEESPDSDPMDLFPRESPAAPPAPISKRVPRKVEPIRVSVYSSNPVPAPPATIAPPVIAVQRNWRSIAIGALAVLVVIQSVLMAVWMFTGAGAASPATTGLVTVTSSPSGSPVTIDGAESGTTPLTLSLAAGSHRIEVGSGAQLRGQELNVTGGGSASIHLELPQVAPPSTAAKEPQQVAARPAAAVDSRGPAPIVPATGWLTVTSGIAMQVFNNGTLVGTTEMPRIVLPTGRHELTLVNNELGYRVTRNIQVAPGQASSLTLQPPMGTLSINALPWAEVWINGQRAGETPIGNLSIAIGNHEVLFRHPELGEKRRAVTVGAQGPTRLGVDMKAP